VTHVQNQLLEPERRVCRVLSQPRSTQRYTPVEREGEERIVTRLHELVRLHPRRGYRMMCGMLRLEGFRVNFKRVHRLWRREGFKVTFPPEPGPLGAIVSGGHRRIRSWRRSVIRRKR
jgi:hypothetical protein